MPYSKQPTRNQKQARERGEVNFKRPRLSGLYGWWNAPFHTAASQEWVHKEKAPPYSSHECHNIKKTRQKKRQRQMGLDARTIPIVLNCCYEKRVRFRNRDDGEEKNNDVLLKKPLRGESV